MYWEVISCAAEESETTAISTFGTLVSMQSAAFRAGTVESFFSSCFDH